MGNYYFEGSTFVIENYNKQKTFANFLPGVAGKKGIPLWSFYVNRAQGISGYGLQDKAKIIMEFTPANKAYETVGTTTVNAFNFENLDPGTSYQIGITAVDFAGNRSEMITHNVQTSGSSN